jgi:flagellar FlgN protein
MTRLPEFSLTLWRQRRLLDGLIYRLEVHELLLANGRHRWLPNATRELEAIIAKIRRHELVRALQASQVGEELGLGPEPTLREITDAAPAPWGDILREHHVALLGLTGQVAELAEMLRDELTTSSRGIADFLNTIAPPSNGDGPLNDVDLRSEL